LPSDLSALRGTKLVLYFYPDFRDRYGDLKRAGCEVYGVSRHSPKSHESFKAKLKNIYGKKGPRHRAQHLRHRREGNAGARMARGEVPSHVEEVLSFAKAL